MEETHHLFNPLNENNEAEYSGHRSPWLLILGRSSPAPLTSAPPRVAIVMDSFRRRPACCGVRFKAGVRFKPFSPPPGDVSLRVGKFSRARVIRKPRYTRDQFYRRPL